MALKYRGITTPENKLPVRKRKITIFYKQENSILQYANIHLTSNKSKQINVRRMKHHILALWNIVKKHFAN